MSRCRTIVAPFWYKPKKVTNKVLTNSMEKDRLLVNRSSPVHVVRVYIEVILMNGLRFSSEGADRACSCQREHAHALFLLLISKEAERSRGLREE